MSSLEDEPYSESCKELSSIFKSRLRGFVMDSPSLVILQSRLHYFFPESYVLLQIGVKSGYLVNGKAR